MTKLAGLSICGWACWQQIAEGAAAAGRHADEIDLASNVLVSVDRDARAARDATRKVLAYYLHRVEPIVRSTSGADPETMARVSQTVVERGLEAGAALVDDELIDAFAAAGDPDHVVERLQAYVDAGIRGLLAWHVLGPDPTRALELLAREVSPRVVNR